MVFLSLTSWQVNLFLKTSLRYAFTDLLANTCRQINPRFLAAESPITNKYRQNCHRFITDKIKEGRNAVGGFEGYDLGTMASFKAFEDGELRAKMGQCQHLHAHKPCTWFYPILRDLWVADKDDEVRVPSESENETGLYLEDPPALYQSSLDARGNTY